MIREARKEDLDALLNLYMYLHEDSIPEHNAHLEKTWNQIVEDPNHHLIVNEIDGQIVSSCVCVIIPNMTRNVRPYAFVENVVTHEDYRGKGYAGECLTYAKKIAEQENIEASEDDIDKEIETIAIQMGTSPRRVRLQIENAGQEDALRNQIVENKVIDMISAAAEFVEVPYELPGSMSTSAINYTAGGEKQEETEEKAEEAPAEEKAE